MKQTKLKRTTGLLPLKQLVLITSTLLFALRGYAQCPPGNVSFNTQAQIDQFIIDYPNCTQISGYLLIGNHSGTTDITNLSPLINITTISAGLDVVNNANLTQLNGLNNLTNIGDQFQLVGNLQLQNIQALGNLTSLGGDINIDNNPSLTDLEGLNGLTTLAGGIQIGNCDALSSLNGLNNITSINGLLNVENLDAITSLNGLSGLTILGGYLSIRNCDAITSLNGLSNLSSIGEYLFIIGNNALTNLNGVTSLTTIQQDIDIENNLVLSDISGLANTTFVPTNGMGLTILNNPVLAICDLPNFCTYLANPAGTHPRNISGNLSNCLDEAAVVAACNTPTSSGCLVTYSAPEQWPTQTYIPNCDNTPEIISNIAWTGEYSKVEVTAGNTYTFSSSVLTDYITISDNNGTVVYAHGTSSVIWTASNNETVRFYLHLSDQCDADMTDRSRIVKCESPVVTDPGCLNADPLLPQWPTEIFIPDCNNSPETIANNAVTNEYSKVKVSAGVSYTFSSSVATDYITIGNNNGTSVYAYGTASVTWTPATTDTIRFYLHLSDQCDGDNIYRSRIIQCNVSQCPAGDVSLSTQAEVDQFIIDYPNCTVIDGNLTIEDGDISNLAGLANIEEVTGDLVFLSVQLLQNVDGLGNLTTVGGNLDLELTDLQNIDGFNSMNSIGGNLMLYENHELQNIDGFNSLQSIGGDLVLQANVVLQNIDGFSSLQTVGGGLGIAENDLLQNIDALHNLTTVNQIGIYDNFELLNLNGLQNIQQINGDVWIEGNLLLNDISGLENIDPATITESSGTGLSILDNPSLAVCHLPNFCTYLSNPATTHPRDISGNLTDCLTEQAVIDACNAPVINCPIGDVILNSQAEVDQFGIDYPNCTHIDGRLDIYGSDITDLSPLNNLISTAGELAIWNCPNLTSINGLVNLTTIGGRIYLGGDDAVNTNAQLTNLNGLSNVVSVGGALIIKHCHQLPNLNGLSQITQINGGVDIENNSQLIDISGIENISPLSITGFGLFIKNNSLLVVCDLTNVCTYLTYNPNTNPRQITGNAGDCVTEAAVTAACQLGISDLNSVDIAVFPNPTTDVIQIKTGIEITRLNVENMLGQVLLNQAVGSTEATIDLSSLPAGNYFVNVTIDGGIKTVKVIKQ